jgi:hypothetical protein
MTSNLPVANPLALVTVMLEEPAVLPLVMIVPPVTVGHVGVPITMQFAVVDVQFKIV